MDNLHEQDLADSRIPVPPSLTGEGARGRILTYLAELDRSMPRVPEDRRRGLIEEVRTHIDRLVEDYEAGGQSTEAADEMAVSMMGPAAVTGRRYARMWYRSTERGSVWTAFLIITVVVGVCSSMVNPYILGIDGIVGDRWTAWTTLWTTLLAGAPQAAGGLIAGWIVPQRVLKGALVRAGVTISSTLLLQLFPPHPTSLIVNLQLENAFGGGLFCVLAALLARRWRMRALAGV